MRALALVLFLLNVTANADARVRAVGHPGTKPSEATPHGWLVANAHVLDAIELPAPTHDLFPLQSMVGSRSIVALGDTTHGTHEFYTVKLRVIDYLVRNMDFDTIAFEAPYPIFSRLNDYIQTGLGDPRAILGELRPLTYFFWDSEEVLALVEWMRDYNVHRGDRPPVSLVGFDVTQPNVTSARVVDYLRDVDPAAAVEYESKYACARVSGLNITSDCEDIAITLRDALASREAELTAKSSATAFADALQYARLVVQSRWAGGGQRDVSMANNTLWLREHRSNNGKMILWAHSAHLSEVEHRSLGLFPMGRILSDKLGYDFFTIATFTAQGMFLQWDDVDRNGVFETYTRGFNALKPTAYETYFRQHGAPYLLIPFNNASPEWLTNAADYNFAGTRGPQGTIGSLPAQYDAGIFIDTTTPVRPLAH